MIKSKHLGEAGWKDLAAKNNVKDNGLVKALGRLKSVGDDDYDGTARVLDEVVKLARLLKKDKAVASAPLVARYLGELEGEAESALRDTAKAKAEHDKAHKARLDDEKKAASSHDSDDEDADTPELLTTQMKPLLRLVAKGETVHALVAKAGKRVVVLLSRKPISPSRRKMLTDQLGGVTPKFYPGTCSVEGGVTTFALKAEVAGMAKLVKLAVLEQTGLRLGKLKCRGDDGDDHDHDDDTPPPGAASAEAKTAPAVADTSAVAPQMAADGMKDEEVATQIVDKQIAILQGWETALRVFNTTMTSSADAEAKPAFQGLVLGYFREKVVGELIKHTPAASELMAFAKAIDGEIQRASGAQASATLRDFVNQHEDAIGKLVQATFSQRMGFIAAVRARREAAGVDEPSRAAPTGNKKPVGKVEVNPKLLEGWTHMRMALMDLLEAVETTLGQSTPERLRRMLSEAWIRQGTVGRIAGQDIPAVVIIRLNPNYSVKNAHIMASGGQKLAEQLLKDFPEGVDVFGLKTRKRILHYNEEDNPQATLELDAGNRDLTAAADKNGKYEALKKYVMSKGLPTTKKLTGD